jgi:metallo-beta-lactamase family protein
MEAMRREMQKRAPELSVKLPEIGETYELRAGKPAKRTKTGRDHLRLATGRDWQNTYGDFVSSLKARLGEIRDAREREKALEQMRKVLDSYSEARGKRREKKR